MINNILYDVFCFSANDLESNRNGELSECQIPDAKEFYLLLFWSIGSLLFIAGWVLIAVRMWFDTELVILVGFSGLLAFLAQAKRAIPICFSCWKSLQIVRRGYIEVLDNVNKKQFHHTVSDTFVYRHAEKLNLELNRTQFEALEDNIFYLIYCWCYPAAEFCDVLSIEVMIE